MMKSSLFICYGAFSWRPFFRIALYFLYFLDQRWLVKKQPCFLFRVAIHQRPESIHRLSYIWLIYWRRITGRKSNYFVFIKLLLSSETLSITIFPFAIERCQFYGILIFYNMIIIYIYMKKKNLLEVIYYVDVI